jgi:hypothetical protein
VELIALADGFAVQLLGECLARLLVFGQPVTGTGRGKRMGERA